MSLDSKQEVLVKLIKRYRETYAPGNPEFMSGKGVSWARLKRDVEKEAVADQQARVAARAGRARPSESRPWTSAEAAGLLNLSQKAFRELAKSDSPPGPLLVDDGTHTAVPISRLLEWADAHPRVRRWRESREDGEVLGRKAPMPPSARFKVLKEGKVNITLIEGRVSSLNLAGWSAEEREALLDLFRAKGGALREDSRGIVMLQQATLADAFKLPWDDLTLKNEWVSQYTGALEGIKSEIQERLQRVQNVIPHLSLEHDKADAQDAHKALVEQWIEEGRALEMQVSEVRGAILDVTLPPAGPPIERPPFRF
ncbi:hypothetical protein NCPPB1935_07100 [Xanthomonas campestris pv. nigromaculans]|nr:hypothetical protein [Xanthomonas campestris pv. nigromaculans]CAH2707526.1 hypothetical protein NCPPB1935_07100 [Xanthomonas campestris pv. nigromaculans]